MTKHVHFIGIAGIGMSATALLMRMQGWEVTGSDEGFYPPASELLPRHGIRVRTPHAADNIPADADLIVVGKHAKLTMDNAEVAAAHATGKPITSYPDVLAGIARARQSLVVVGSYGKSTTASLVAWALTEAGCDPGYFVGAVPKNLGINAGLGTAPEFVIEGDEYPSSNTDPRAKFLHYDARTVLLTAAVHDHVNIFPTQADYEKPFVELIERLPQDGLLVVCKDEPHAMRVAAHAPSRVVTYALKDTSADYYLTDIVYGEISRFTLVARGKELGRFHTHLLGAHNLQNMAGAAALLLEKGLLTAADLQKGFASFLGVVRRMDKLTATSSVPVYEGFGSSREKARAAIDAIELHFPGRRLHIVFEPHTFSWRNRATIHWYDDVFRGADHLFMSAPPEHGAESHDQVSYGEIAERVSHNRDVTVVRLGHDQAENIETIVATLAPGDVVLLLTSGDLGGMIVKLVARMEELFGAPSLSQNEILA
ncbi:MAG: UDP-N-acetylmuramate--L-alanyl-gamma-D-glutamyl-meso-diaminopimelate ligase [Hyphomicrobiales bacterium]|nr:UDP-N-acetylmuramate--L-alanyl-gamma-D-glutamyl-meso-diaminopimelate ligase [Hyphomicrobiales bacterium]